MVGKEDTRTSRRAGGEGEGEKGEPGRGREVTQENTPKQIQGRQGERAEIIERGRDNKEC